MPSNDGLSNDELKTALKFMMKFGSDWIENDRVRAFIIDDQINGVWMHKLLEDKIDSLSPIKRITHRKLKQEVLDKISNHGDDSVE